jgi:tight adherence protein B
MRVLAMLPLAGIALGMLLGSNPVGWLVTTVPGRFMLMGAVAFEVVGWLWVRAIVRRVQRRV